VRAVALSRSLPSRQPTAHSYLLRVVVGAAGVRRYVVQDLRSGERRDFDSEVELRQFLSRARPQQLR